MWWWTSPTPYGTSLYLINEAPDEPYGGGVGGVAVGPGVDYAFADPDTTGQVMKFNVVQRTSVDRSVPPQQIADPVTGRKLGKSHTCTQGVR